MLFRLFLLFVLVPLIELALLIRVGGWIGVWPTIGIVMATGLLGAVLARGQGLAVLGRIRAEVAVGRMPVQSLLDGLMVLIGAVLLLTPGVLTDLLGISLLLPGSRAAYRRLAKRRLARLLPPSASNREVGQTWTLEE